MDLELWALADPGPRRRRVGRRAERGAGRRAGRAVPRAATLPAVLQDGLAALPGAGYGHRAVAEIDLGLPRWSDDPTHVLGRAGQLPAARRPGRRPRTPSSPAARGPPRRRSPQVVAAGPHARLARRARLVRLAAAPGPAAGRAARDATSTTWSGCSRTPAAELRHRRAPSWPRAAGSTEPDDVFFLDLREARSALRRTAGPARAWSRGRRAGLRARSCAAGTCPRVLLSDGTEPEALAARTPARPPATLVGTPASAGTVTATARGSSSTRSARTWSRARSWSPRPPTPAGRRCSSPRAGW